MNNIFFIIQKDLSKIKKYDYKINYDLDFRSIIVFDLCYF
jgi:hypothetical protein